MARELSTLETLIRDRLGTAWSEDNQLFEQFYVYAKERGSKPKTNVIIRLVITKTGGKSLELGVNATLLDSPLFPSDAGEHVFNDL